MATVPEANRILWEALDAIYATQCDAAQAARQAVSKLATAHPDLVRDPLAREALRAAVERQDGIVRYAQSQMALAETMRAHWAQRVVTDTVGPDTDLVPLVRRSNPFLANAVTPRSKAPVPVGD
ncbi:MAG: hypothetical protein RLO51_24055 [Thalassobaculum sp.]|uniref:hypothetical protein n=1 Tax=Thalassobaculum sp. TaxID=2022740 RepID=UPI0032ECA70D